MKTIPSISILVIFLSFMITGCSRSDTPGKIQIPEYPGAIADQEHEAKYFGMSFGKVKRVVTGDSYDTVLAYYREILEADEPEVISHTLKDGRLTAMTITENGHPSMTIAIQESKKKGQVSITYMSVGL